MIQPSVLGRVFRAGHTDRSRGTFGKACAEYTRRVSPPVPSFTSSIFGFARSVIQSTPRQVSANLDVEADDKDEKTVGMRLGNSSDDQL